MMDIDFKSYNLSCELRGHEDDVRRICVCRNAGIATSSRDKTVRFWAVDPANKYKDPQSKILLGHTSFVGPLAWISPSEEFPEGRLVSGGMDTMVFVWDVKSGEKVQTLSDHKMQVTGIALDGDDIVSASVDCSVKRWRNGKLVESLEAHGAAIQAVITLSSGEIATASSDTTFKLWKRKTCVHTFTGHTDTVRGLAEMPDLGVLSASHDGSVRLWALTGEVLLEMVGHTSIVYSVDSLSSGKVVSGSEDCSARIWKDGVCVQTLEHPGCVWDVKFLDNGDLVTACSDGVVRIWTAAQERTADHAVLQSYLSQISQYKLSRKKVGGLKLDELPGLDALKVPGTSNGATKIVREGDNGVAYSWNASEYKWDKIGEVVDGPDSSNRPLYDGVPYDYVFDVDIGDGLPIRKLPYNMSDDPYDVADKWLVKEDLPAAFRSQVVDFILQNTGKKNFSFDSSYRDPYTGSSSYVPGQPSNSQASTAKPSYKHIPKKGMLVFDSAQFDGILKKISEFNTTLISNEDQKKISLSEIQLSRLGAVVKILKDTSFYHSSCFADVDVDFLLNLLGTWPVSMVFPVIDLLRMIILHPDGASKLCKRINSGNDALFSAIKKVNSGPANPAYTLTSLRLVCNLFKDACFHPWLLKNRCEVLDAFSSCVTSSNKNVQLAYSTVVLNFSVLLIAQKDEEGQAQALSSALEIAEVESLDVDARFRALVAIGTLMLEGVVKKIALDFDVQSIAKASIASNEAKIAEVGADIELLVKHN